MTSQFHDVLKAFQSFPSEAPLWIYAFETELTDDQLQLVRQKVSEFLTTWNSHGQPVQGQFFILYHRFVFLSGVTSDSVSGCSIDSSVRIFKDFRKLGLEALNRTLIFYRSSPQEIVAVSRPQFVELVTKGLIKAETIVFDTAISTVASIHHQDFEKTFSQSWHAKQFPLELKI